jgi:hypothetical protein
MNRPSALYKFVAPERIDVLEKGVIRFTQPSALNDPFELQPLFEMIIPEEEFEESATPPFEMIEEEIRRKYHALAPAQQEQLPSLATIIELVKANPAIIEGLLANVVPALRRFASDFTPRLREMIADALAKNVGILSLSENPLHPLLWAHYAQSHKGFAIEFDSHHPYFDRRRSETDELYHLRRVRYIDRRADGRALRDLDGDDVLVTKGSSWSYEAEWRILAHLDDAERVLTAADDTIYLFPFPLEAVSGVVLGARVPQWLREGVEDVLKSSGAQHIRVERAVLDTGKQTVTILNDG